MKFNFFIGGYFAGHFEVILKKEELHFYIYQRPINIKEQYPTHIISIKEDLDWNNLIQFMNHLKWNKEYNSEIMDGIQWTLDFNNDNKKINCYGSNAFPKDFELFKNLLKKILIKNNISFDELL